MSVADNTTSQAQDNPHSKGEIDDDEHQINVIDVFIVLAKHKKLILGLPIVVALLSIVITLQLTPVYTANTKILPPQQTQSTSAVLAQLGGLAGLGAMSGGLRNPNDLYVGMLRSRTIADNIIKRFDLNKLYERKYQSDTRKELEDMTSVIAGRDGVIAISVDDEDPKRSAEMANAYVEELFKLTKVLAVTEASQRRLFFERQMEQAREGLVKAEAAMRDALKTGLVQVESEGRVMAESSARLRAQITVSEVQIGAMRAFATNQNPEVLRKLQEVEAMRRELAVIEGTSVAKSPPHQATNDKGINNLRQLREMKYYEATYDLLARQFEIAKIDEAKDSAVIQVMDYAIEPELKSKPKRALIVLLATSMAGFVAILLVFVREALGKIKADPLQTERLSRLKYYLGLKRGS